MAASNRRGWIVLGLLLVPGVARAEWTQAYGDISNTSFVPVMTAIGPAPRWSVDLAGRVDWGGPSIGPDQTVYLGTSNGVFQAFGRDGKERCSLSFPDGVFSSTPAVLPDGNVAMLMNRGKTSQEMQGELLLLSADCRLLWSRELPRMERSHPSVASGSVKVWTLNRSSFLFVHARRSNVNVNGADPALDGFNEILIYDTTGEIFARKMAGRGCIRVEGSGILGDALGYVWDFIEDFIVPVGQHPNPPLYKKYGWPDSTPAIWDRTLNGFSSPAEPLVAVTDHSCENRVELYRFRPSLAFNDRLVSTWSKSIEPEGALLASPVVTDDGRLLVGSNYRRIKAFDIATQTFLGIIGLNDPVLHPPALGPGVWAVGSEFLVTLTTPAMTAFPTARPLPMYTRGSIAAVAISSNQIFAPGWGELGLWSFDLRDLTHALYDETFNQASPALTAEGRLYVPVQVGERGVLFAFGPP